MKMNPNMITRGGGMMLRRAGNVLTGRAAIQQTANTNSSSNSHSSSKTKPAASSSYSCSTEEEEECVGGRGEWRSLSWSWEGEGEGEYEEDQFVFGGGGIPAPFDSPPTKQEVEEAVSNLQSAFPFSGSQSNQTSLPLSSVEHNNDPAGVAESLESNTKSCKTVVDWIEPELHFSNRGVVQPLGHNNVFDAFQLLQNSPAVQGMVVSLASDKAIWDAVLKNEQVVEFRKSLQKGGSNMQEITEGSDDASAAEKTNLFAQTMENVKLKVTEYMEKITELIHNILGFADKKVFAESD
ncbi:hypothetical protein KI387_022916 [Taxus chinensis]|uniref:Uncharacterized protein n=1 Tax=Taxus chinensis TaxID=29808 RepID=A0AA38G1B1_TAXCH|nr:hypothetical protein KI387_022916 [Taxus chinensis]